MNLANTYAIVKKLFFRNEPKTIRPEDLSEHLRRDIGLDNEAVSRRADERPLPQKEIVVLGHLTRAP